MRHFIFILCLLFTSATFASNTIKVGTISGPESDLMKVAKEVAKKEYDLNIKIIEFSDYIIPNTALSEGSIDANMFQHLPYLESYNKIRGTNLVSIGKEFVYPMGVYSFKLKTIKNIKDKSLVAIPNDPSNESRALLLLQEAGLIKLKNLDHGNYTKLDIIENSRDLRFKTLDAAQLARVLLDVDIAVINTNYAVLVGLSPSHDAIFAEDSGSLYANIIAVRAEDKNKKEMKELVQALHSKSVILAAQKLFKGDAIRAW